MRSRTVCDVPTAHLCGDLHQIAGEDLAHPFDASAYVLADSGILIDCGTAQGHELIVANLRELGLRPADLTAILATHGHYDHLSGLAAFKARAGVPAFLHVAEHEAVRTGDPVLTTARALYDSSFAPVTVDNELPEGVTDIAGRSIEVLHTPGHSPGSVSFVVQAGKRRVLLAGDTLWGGFHPAIGSDIPAWQHSMAKLMAAEFECMSFGHGIKHLVMDAPDKVRAAAGRLGVYFNPWFEPPYSQHVG